jgi:amino acid efflux transporter
VTGSAHAAHGANWTPFAPHGWLSIGRAASTLMLSFVGWEAVAPLTGRLRAGQLPRVIGIAFGVTALLYLGLAVATISCLGRGADLSVPLADLLQLAMGPAGRAVAAVAALILTAGSVNAYLSGATEMLRELTARPGHRAAIRPGVFLAFIAVTGLALIGLSAAGLAGTAALVSVPTTMFVAVYLSCTVSAVRLLAGLTRLAAAVAILAVLVILAFCGWGLAAAAAVALAAGATVWAPSRRAAGTRARPGPAAGPGGAAVRPAADRPALPSRTGTPRTPGLHRGLLAWTRACPPGVLRAGWRLRALEPSAHPARSGSS